MRRAAINTSQFTLVLRLVFLFLPLLSGSFTSTTMHYSMHPLSHPLAHLYIDCFFIILILSLMYFSSDFLSCFNFIYSSIGILVIYIIVHTCSHVIGVLEKYPSVWQSIIYSYLYNENFVYMNVHS